MRGDGQKGHKSTGAGEKDLRAQLPVIRRLFSETVSRHSHRYLQAIACMVMMAASTGALAWLMRHVVNEVFVARNLEMMWAISAAVFVVSAVKGLADYGQTVVLARIGNDIVADLQRRAFDKMLTLGIGYFGQHHSAKIISRFSTNANAARSAVTRISTSLGRDLLTVVALVIVMIVQDPLMSISALVVGPLVFVSLQRLVRETKELSKSELQGIAAVMQSAQETVQGIKVVKSFTMEQDMRERFDRAVREIEIKANSLVAIRAKASPLMETLGGALIAAVILYAGWQTIAAGRAPGEFMAFLTAFLLAYEPAKRLAKTHVALQRDLAGVKQLFQFLDQHGPEPETAGGHHLSKVGGKIALTDVTFGYDRKKPVLKKVSIVAEPGEVVALVGPSGAGKSTVGALIQRFYPPWSGKVEIDGIPVSDINLKSLRRQISVVSQDTIMFSGSIRENIALGKPGAGDAEIVAAAEAAYAMPFIRQMPDGLETQLGERGATLSGGEVQRLCIARAFLKNAPILLLDEATSSLDAEAERQVQYALQMLMAGKTTLVIAHRLSTVERADRTYLLADGEVIASGKHEELLEANELYKQLFAPTRSVGPDRTTTRAYWGVTS